MSKEDSPVVNLMSGMKKLMSAQRNFVYANRIDLAYDVMLLREKIAGEFDLIQGTWELIGQRSGRSDA